MADGVLRILSLRIRSLRFSGRSPTEMSVSSSNSDCGRPEVETALPIVIRRCRSPKALVGATVLGVSQQIKVGRGADLGKELTFVSACDDLDADAGQVAETAWQIANRDVAIVGAGSSHFEAIG